MPTVLRILTVLAPIAGGLGVLAWRIQETRTPVTAKKIILPPLGMSTGFSMFVSPAMRIPWTLGLAAFAVGALVLSYPLARTSSLERNGDVILMKRSNGFILILLGLLSLRLALHDYIGHLLPPAQTAALFFVLAFGMILRWRVVMYLRFRKLSREPLSPSAR
jgi:membrane protein CcdC involved in cytochrome C biogenesis